MKPVNASICMKTSAYKSKKVCLVSGVFSFSAAKAKCLDNGMYLVPIITQADLNEFNVNVIGNLLMELMSGTTNKFWVNGELNGTPQQWTYTTSSSGVISAMINSGTGACLQSKSSLAQISPGSYQLYQSACSTTLSAMCFF